MACALHSMANSTSWYAIKASHPGAAPVVIAMSGYTDSSQRDLARAAGFDHYLTKPVDLALLYQLIAGNAV